MKNVLMILTSCSEIKGMKNGVWLEEAITPYQILSSNPNINLKVVSIKGGEVPIDEASILNGIPENFKKDMHILDNTLKLADVLNEKFDAILLPGGHGPLFDFKDNHDVQKIIKDTYSNGNIVATICHGAVSLLNIDYDGSNFINGKKVVSFSDTEEDKINCADKVPYSSEQALKDNGGIFSKGEDLKCNVVVDGNLITAQNPQSSAAIAELICEKLK